MIRALIVDDERLARTELRRLLAAHAEIEIIGEAANISDAERAINELQPELIFLDVQMPGGSGFDLLAALDDAPEVIFTTAFDAYALKAFEVNALDYLQKPIEAKRLAAALQRAQLRVAKNQVTLKPDNKIFIKDGERCWFVALTDISLFESEGNYARVYFQTEAGQHRPLILRSLNQLDARLDQTTFFRANRRQIINLDFIKRVAPADAGGLSLVLQNDLIIDLSRRRAMEFRAMSSL
jgi:two-component system, LytTR family, response regulator